MPGRRAIPANGFPARQYVRNPTTGDFGLVEHGKARTVVLEAQAAGGTPDGNQIVVCGHRRPTRCEKATEPYGAALPGLFEEQEWRYLRALLGRAVGGCECVPQQKVATSRCVVQFPARRPVVSEVGEGPRLLV